MTYSKAVTLTEENGVLKINTPYNGLFVKQLKKLVPSAKFTGSIWTANAVSKEQVEGLLEKFFPVNLQKVRITWSLSRDNPRIDDTELMSVSRDYWNWRSNCPISFAVISGNDLKSGGSRNNPGMFGELVIEAEIRPDADISPYPESVEILSEAESQQQPLSPRDPDNPDCIDFDMKAEMVYITAGNSELTVKLVQDEAGLQIIVFSENDPETEIDQTHYLFEDYK